MYNTNHKKWTEIYTKCQEWRNESWKLQGLPPIVQEKSQNGNDVMNPEEKLKLSGEILVRRFQTQSSQFLYERDKKRKRPVLVLSDENNHEEVKNNEKPDYSEYTFGNTI